MSARFGVGLVGCGKIAGAYAADLARYPEVRVAAVTDVVPERAAGLARELGCRAHGSLEELLADDGVEVVVNLTVPRAHAGVTEACLRAGRHVYSEKPLALGAADARRLVELAAATGVRLACSPCTLLGEAQQTAWKCLREGAVGTVRVVYAEANGGRIESSHPAPAPFYETGPLLDIGVYPLTLATAMLGPARRVTAQGGVLAPTRVALDGSTFEVGSPDFLVATIELDGGALLRLTANFYVARRGTKQAGVEFHGDDGSLWLSDWQRFDGAVECKTFADPYRPVALVAEAYAGTEWGRGVLDLVGALAEGRAHRASGEHAAHVVEVAEAAFRSIELGRPVEVRSGFEAPAPMPWAV